jgi:hypothetical protein
LKILKLGQRLPVKLFTIRNKIRNNILLRIFLLNFTTRWDAGKFHPGGICQSKRRGG